MSPYWSFNELLLLLLILLLLCLLCLVVVSTAVYVTDPASNSPSDPVMFNKVQANLGNMWSPSEHKFTLTATLGIYYVTLGAGSNFNTAIDYKLMKSDSPFVSCNRDFGVSSSADTVARDIMFELKTGETLHMSSSTGVWSGDYSSLGIFSLSDVMDGDLVAFSVARTSLLAGSANPFPFSFLLVNEGSAYDEFTHYFIAPATGIYFFSFSVGVMEQLQTNITVYRNQDKFIDIRRDSTVHPGDEVIGRSVMLSMNQGDTINLANAENVVYSSALLETSFTGFQYLPAHGIQVCKLNIMLLLFNLFYEFRYEFLNGQSQMSTSNLGL